MWDCGFVCSAVAGLDISPEGALFTDDDVHEGIAINKDLFLLVIQDTELRHVMPVWMFTENLYYWTCIDIT